MNHWLVRGMALTEVCYNGRSIASALFLPGSLIDLSVSTIRYFLGNEQHWAEHVVSSSVEGLSILYTNVFIVLNVCHHWNLALQLDIIFLFDNSDGHATPVLYPSILRLAISFSPPYSNHKFGHIAVGVPPSKQQARSRSFQAQVHLFLIDPRCMSLTCRSKTSLQKRF